MDWNALAQSLGGVAWEIAKPILAVLITYIGVLLAKKIGLSVSADQQAKLEKQILDILVRAEELKANGKAPELDKLSWATGEIQRLAPKLDPNTIEDLVHSLLPRIGLGATAPKAMPLEVVGGAPR